MMVLVTGAAGLIGGAVCREMTNRGVEFVAADRLLDDELYGRDLSDQGAAEAIVARCRPDVVLHLAASPGRAFNEHHPRQALMDGIVATTLVAEACTRHDAKLIYASTSEVYGDHGETIVNEDSATTPSTGTYGLMKLWGEQICRHHAPEGLLVLRPLMVYGPHQRVGPGWAALPTFIANAIDGRRISVHAGARRSWCYVDDVARAICDLVELGAVGVFNVGRDDEEYEMIRIAEIACDLAGTPRSLIDVVGAPQLQTVVKRVSCARVYLTGWRPQVSLIEGMEIVYEHLSSFPSRASV